MFRTLIPSCFFLFTALPLVAQPGNGSGSAQAGPVWFASFQPLVFAEPSGGFKAGGEMVLGKRYGVALDLAARFNNYIETDLQDGERNHRSGYQVQPEFKYYLHEGDRARRRGFRSLGSALSLRGGYTHYNTGFRTWTRLVDGSGNAFQKLLSHTRVQRNYDASVLLSGRLYFGRQGEGLGLELFAGFGVRIKKFSYINLSPELSADQLRSNDENRRFTLLRDGSYPLFPVGVRFFYRFN